MNPEQITALRAKIGQHPKLNEEERLELLALLPPASEGEDDHDLGKEIGDVGRELQHVVRKFEARHPQFTELADKVLNYLSRMGI